MNLPPIFTRHAAVAMLLVTCLVAPASGADDGFQINGKNSGEEIPVRIPAGGRAVLRLTRTSQAADSADLQVLGFTSESGETIVGQLSPHDGKPVGPQLAILPGSGALIDLIVPPPPTSEKYVGPVIVRTGGTTRIWSLALVRGAESRSATLVVDRRADVERSITLPPFWFISQKNPPFTVNVFEQSRLWPLDGVTARIEQVKAPGGAFDFGENLALRFDDRAMSTGGPGIGEQAVAAGGQATIRGELKKLRPGEYDVALRFQAANSNDSDLQKVRLHLFVKHSWVPVLALLMVALLVSFLATRVVAMLQMRADFLNRLREVRPGWLNSEPPVLPIVWVRAVLRQSEDLSRRYWLTGQGRIDSRVTELDGLVQILERVKRIREAFDRAIGIDFIRVRAQGALSGIVAGIGAGSFPAATADAVGKDLDKVVTWIDSAQQKSIYWGELSRAIEKLVSQVGVDAITKPEAQVELLKLLTKLKDDPKDDLAAMTSLESEYAWLKILWERRSNEEFDQMIALRKKTASLADLFAAADEAAWNRLQACVKADKLKIVPPPSVTGETLAAYDPLTFKVQPEDPDDPTLGATYLFLHQLEFRWTFTLTPRMRSKDGNDKQAAPIRLTPRTNEPQVVQYAPTQGTLEARVDIVRNNVTLKGPAIEIPIGSSGDFDIWKISERTDVIAFALAGIAAIVSGMYIYYAKSPTFGSAADYLALATWGIGMDQGKNLLLATQTYTAAQKP